MQNMVYIQSGGPTSVINSSLYGAIKEAQKHADQIDHIYGSLNGIEGLIDDKLIDLGKEDAHQIDLLVQTPGAALGTTRRKLPKDVHDPIYMTIVKNMQKHDIKYVFINGGNDSMDTCHKISNLCKELNLDIHVIGVPKTIDNDLACTDHSLGFPSAAKFVINMINALVQDARCFKVGKVHIVEIMGRNAGWLTAAADLVPDDSRPDLIYLPERKFNIDEFVEDVKKVYERTGYCVAAVSEGVQFERDSASVRVDSFGHVQLGGTGAALAHIVDTRLGLPTRAVEFSLTQRADPFLVSKVDRDEAVEVGRTAVRAAIDGANGKMVIIKRINSHPYKSELQLADLSLVANAEQMIPESMMYDRTRMADSFREYLKPLIQGEVDVAFKDGIAEYTHLQKYLVK